MSDFDDRKTSSRYSDKNGGRTVGRRSQQPQQGNGPYPQPDMRGNYQYPPPGQGNGPYPQPDMRGNYQYPPPGQGNSPYPQPDIRGNYQYPPPGGQGNSRYQRQTFTEESGRMKEKRKKKRKIWPVILILLLVLAAAAGAVWFLTLGKVKRTAIRELIINSGAVTESGYQNIVLYGVDSREGKLTEEAHSDTIIICSINKKTKDVRLVSVYRDTYLDNTNGEYRKATECYYFGGPERSINMLNKNLDLDIRDYVTLDFAAVIEIVDGLGGIDLEITPEEMEYINGYCVENNLVTGVEYTPLTESGYVHLDGIQALAYCRIRYTEGWDFKRTERQREVLSLCYHKARQQGPAALVSIVNALLPKISTSMNAAELVRLAGSISSYNIEGETGFPFEQTPADIDGSDVVVPTDLAANVSELHRFLFDQDDYEPSQTVQEISNYISSRY